jgi:Domain of Unknown Function (DUF1080)
MVGKLLVGLLLLAGAGYGRAAERIFDWSTARLNMAPEEFRALTSGTGAPGEWKILLDTAPSAFPAISPKATNRTLRPVLAQVSRDQTDARYPMLVYEGETFGDFTVTTEFKIVDGVAEQMAGIAFRIQDERNYFYIRASALGQNVSFFKVQDGQLVGPIGGKAEIPRGTWQEMSIQCRGNEIRCSLNGKEVFPPLKDSTFGGGKIGFWTKSDSVSYFGTTRITYTPTEILAQILVRDAIKKYPRLRGVSIIAATTNSSSPRVIASSDAGMVGQPAQTEVLDVLARGIIYHAEEKGTVHLTMPLRDSNGDNIAAVKLAMKAFPGQTDKNVLARAVPIIKHLESRVRNASELVN